MKKILYVSMSLPYNDVQHAGGQTLNYYIKKIATQEMVDVKLISYSSDEYSHIEELKTCNIDPYLIYRKKDFKNFFRNILSLNSKLNPYHKYCNLMTWNASNLLLKKIKSLKRMGYYPDIIIMEWTQIVLQINEIKKIYPDSKYISSEPDVTFLGISRKVDYASNFIMKAYRKKQYVNTLHREINALKSSDLIVVQNSKDKDLLIEHGVVNVMEIVPYFHQSKLTYGRVNNDILFFGYMKRYENRISVKWFIDNVMPLLDDVDCRFVIIGGGVDDEIKSWVNDKVLVTGYVKEIDGYFASGMCSVSPLLLGAGIKVKVLEALYTGIPVLTNKIGIEGIPAEDGKDYLHCETAEEYATRIKEIIASTTPVVSGREFMDKAFSPEHSFNEYYKAILEVL